MELVIADKDGRAVMQTDECELDMAYGADENDFSLTLPTAIAPPRGGMVYLDGTEWGGWVDEVTTDTATRFSTCRGRTFHGVLAGKRLVPDGGASHLSVSGDVGAALRSVLSRVGLLGAFEVAEGIGGSVSYTFERFCDAWSGIRSMLRSCSMRPSIACVEGSVIVGAEPVRTVGDAADSDAVEFSVTEVARCVNHLVCGGTGEDESRVVLHFYADAAGNVGDSQTLFGVDEIAAFYDYSNADEGKLREDGRAKLEEMQTEGAVEITVPDELEAAVGDVLVGRDNATGVEVAAEVVKKVLKLSYGVPSISYEVGQAATTAGTISGSAESSGGGASYVAGEGISISGGRISADVTRADLDAVGATADDARKTASDAQAAAGRAQQTADGKADAGHKHSKADVTDFPASMPASDVSAWAKAPTKPTYTAAEVGAAAKAHGHAWGEVTGRPTEYPPEAHTHPYAGSASAGGAATSAVKLETPRKIAITGAVSGSAAFDGSADVEITVEGDSAAAGFLAAHPVGFYATCKAGVDPNGIGGTWEQAPSVGPCVWLRTK